MVGYLLIMRDDTIFIGGATLDRTVGRNTVCSAYATVADQVRPDLYDLLMYVGYAKLYCMYGVCM